MAWKFAESVKQGADVTLAGAVPVAESQRADLGLLAGCDFERMPVSTSKRSVFLWSCPKGRKGDEFLTEVFFDANRATGIDISTAIRVHN